MNALALGQRAFVIAGVERAAGEDGREGQGDCEGLQGHCQFTPIA